MNRLPSRIEFEYLSIQECIDLFKSRGLHVPPDKFHEKFFIHDVSMRSEHFFILGERFCLDYQISISFYVHKSMTEDEIRLQPHFGPHIQFHNPYGPAAQYWSNSNDHFYIDGIAVDEEDHAKKRTILRIKNL